MIDTAGTITKAADALMAEGAKRVVIAATHAILSGPAVDRLKAANVDEVIVTNTLPIPEDRRFDKLTVLSIAPLIARAIREVNLRHGSGAGMPRGRSGHQAFLFQAEHQPLPLTCLLGGAVSLDGPGMPRRWLGCRSRRRNTAGIDSWTGR